MTTIAFPTIILLPILLSVIVLGWGFYHVMQWAGTAHYSIPSVFVERIEMLIAFAVTAIIWIMYFLL